MKKNVRQRLRTSLRYVSAYFLLCVTTVIAPTKADWFDDFSDGDIMDGDPVTWSVNPGGFFPGDYGTDDDNIVMVPLDGDNNDETMIAWVDAEDFETTASVRTRATILTEPADFFTGRGNVGPLMFFNPMTLTGYLGVLDDGNGLFLISGDGGGATTTLGEVDLDFNATEEVFVQLDHDGTFVSLSAWRVDDPQPETPQITVENDTYLFGKSGLIFNEDGAMDAAFYHMAQASSQRIVDGEELRGDFNLDGSLDGGDIDALMNEVAAESNDAAFDLNSDNLVNDSDRDEWLAIAGPHNGFAGPYFVGDADLNGAIDVADLNAVGLTWQTPNNDWTKGNFSGANTDVVDLNEVGLNWQQSVPLAAAAESVPEPSTSLLVFWAVAGFLCRRR